MAETAPVVSRETGETSNLVVRARCYEDVRLLRPYPGLPVASGERVNSYFQG